MNDAYIALPVVRLVAFVFKLRGSFQLFWMNVVCYYYVDSEYVLDPRRRCNCHLG